MLDRATLKDLLHKPELSRKDETPILGGGRRPIWPRSELKELGIASGLRRVKQWNLSDVLGKGEPQAIRGSGGFGNFRRWAKNE